MTIITFPSSPWLYQSFSAGSKTWIWNGSAWDLATINSSTIFAQANAAFVTANSGASFANSAYTNANSAYNTANLAYTTANNALSNSGGTITGSLNINSNLVVQGNLSVFGNSTTIYTTSLETTDSLIYLANGNFVSDAIDIGIIGHYNNSGNAHTGIFRDPNLKEWIFFQGYTPEVQSNNIINIADPSFSYANVYSSVFKGNVIANYITLNGTDAFTFINSAFTKANSALPNTAGVTTAGSIIVPGTVQSTAVTATSNIRSNVFTTGVSTNTTVVGATTVDLSISNYFKYTITGSTTFSFVNPPVTSNAVVFVMSITNGGSSPVVWPGTVRWPGGTAPTLTTSGVDILVFSTDDGGSNYRGLASQINSS